MQEMFGELLSSGMIELLSSDRGETRYHIPAMRHRKLTGFGWQDVTYILTIDDEAEPGCRYAIDSDSDYSGGENVLATDDPDEVEAWIQDRVEET